MSTNTPETERRRLWPFEEHGMSTKTKLLRRDRYRPRGTKIDQSCTCLDPNPVHCALIRDALVTGDDCFRPRRCECGCHRGAP